jgi:hypothetical protein
MAATSLAEAQYDRRFSLDEGLDLDDGLDLAEVHLFTAAEAGSEEAGGPSTTARTLAYELPDRYRVVTDFPKPTTDGFAILDVAHMATVVGAIGLNLLVWDTPQAQDSHVSALQDVKCWTNLPWEEIAGILGVSRMSVDAWTKGQAISFSNQLRLLTVRDILLRAGEHHSDLRTWLATPSERDGRTPLDFLKSGNFDRVRYLALADTSSFPRGPSRSTPRLRRNPNREYVKEALPPDPSEIDNR